MRRNAAQGVTAADAALLLRPGPKPRTILAEARKALLYTGRRRITPEYFVPGRSRRRSRDCAAGHWHAPRDSAMIRKGRFVPGRSRERSRVHSNTHGGATHRMFRPGPKPRTISAKRHITPHRITPHVFVPGRSRGRSLRDTALQYIAKQYNCVFGPGRSRGRAGLHGTRRGATTRCVAIHRFRPGPKPRTI